MARKRATLTDLLNDLTYKTIYDRYKLIAVNEWEWQNLPEGILPRHIETICFDRGFAGFFRDPAMSYMCLQADNGVGLNVNGDPLSYRVTGFNYNKEYKADDIVIIENNLLRIPTSQFILHYVNKLAEAERTMDVNVKACKTPVVFTCDDKDILTWKRLFQQVDGNAPAVFADKGLNLDSVQAFLTGVKFLGNELMDYKASVESDLLTFLGQNNTPVDKKERLITSEADANNQLIQSFADLQLEARQRACEAINEKWGLNVTVRRRSEPVEKPVETVENPEGGNNNVA